MRGNLSQGFIDAFRNAATKEQRDLIRVIGVMGITGTGKSTFIQKLTNDQNILVGNSLHSETSTVKTANMTFRATDGKQYTLYIADTPGFDDTQQSDTQVLQNIVTWLGALRENEVKLSGIIYLHRITDERMGGIGARNLSMLANLVGPNNMRNVMLVTNHWEDEHLLQPQEQAGWRQRSEKREIELTRGGVRADGSRFEGFWTKAISYGARFTRHDNTFESARNIADEILVSSPPVYIQIQNEVHAGMDLVDTAAGKAIQTELEKQAALDKERLRQMQQEMNTALKNAKDNALLIQMQKDEFAELKRKMEKDLKEQKDLLEADNLRLKREIEERRDGC